MNKVLKGNLIFLSFILLVALFFIKKYNGENILFALSLFFYVEIIFLTIEFLKYMNLDKNAKGKSIFNRKYKNKFIKKALLEEKLDPISNIYTRF